MLEPLLQRIERLEHRVRLWRNTSLLLAAALLSVSAMGIYFAVGHQRLRAIQAELVAREQAQLKAEAAQLRAEVGEQLRLIAERERLVKERNKD
jgi:uncharacterized membrane protein affecting hemolysin expression